MAKGIKKKVRKESKSLVHPQTRPESIENPVEPKTADAQAGQPIDSSRDLLVEFRKSLMEDEIQGERTGFFRQIRDRLGKLFKKRLRTQESKVVKSRVELPASAGTRRRDQSIRDVNADFEKPASPEGTDGAQIVESGAILDVKRKPVVHPAEKKEATPQPPTVQTPSTEESPKTVKTRLELIPGAQDTELDAHYQKIREIALEEYAEGPTEPVTKSTLSLVQEARSTVREMSLSEKRILFVLVLFAGVMALLLGYLFLTTPSHNPVPTATPVPLNSPYPISIGLPGGWTFSLGQGTLQNGKWNPAGAEWLKGTEICRWVSLPWSVQLQAVIGTMKADNSIALTMSNDDHLVFKVQSIQQIPVDQIGKLDTHTPCLIVILAKEDTSTRWVIRARP